MIRTGTGLDVQNTSLELSVAIRRSTVFHSKASGMSDET